MRPAHGEQPLEQRSHPQGCWTREGAFPASVLAGVLASLFPSGHEVDFTQRLEVLQHEGGQAVGLPPSDCLLGNRSIAEAGSASPRAAARSLCSHDK